MPTENSNQKTVEVTEKQPGLLKRLGQFVEAMDYDINDLIFNELRSIRVEVRRLGQEIEDLKAGKLESDA